MRSLETGLRSQLVYCNNANAAFPGGTVTSLGSGQYDIRLTDRGARDINVIASGSPGAPLTQVGSALNENPPRMQVQFMTAGGGGGAYGGYAHVFWKRSVA
jgi:hypothetical protein